MINTVIIGSYADVCFFLQKKGVEYTDNDRFNVIKKCADRICKQNNAKLIDYWYDKENMVYKVAYKLKD